MAKLDSIGTALGYVADLADFAALVARLAQRGEVDRLDEIFPDQLRTTIAKALADERAARKWSNGGA